MKLEPLIKKEENGYEHKRKSVRGKMITIYQDEHRFKKSDVKSAYNFYITYTCQPRLLKEKEPEHWKVWEEYRKKYRTVDFSDWLLNHSFQDVID